MSAKIKITCLIDNTVSFGSGYWGEHGLSFYIESNGVRVLLDTGQTEEVLSHNLKVAGIDLDGLDAIVLSHGHYDHTGGLREAAGRAGKVRIVVHPAAFESKYARKEGKFKEIGIPFGQSELKEHCELVQASDSIELGGGVFTTGEVKRVTSYELPHPDLMVDQNGSLIADPVRDDQSIVIDAGDDLILLCGCCHAGIVNTIEHVKNKFGKYPVLVAGGLHMANVSEERMERSIAALKQAGIKKIIPGHCSGREVLLRASEAGIDAEPLSAGMKLEF
ncbi:MBL fold metallo-hydrolase [Methanocella sp. CWC-04]|uniref:MBL fold metallo-hydrolase n=1 Tax=Methanooceanicella nereidis TaxID=2052831 RepID=A0AAP2RG35_9EURY|nr:MBL fold metallo-hydrolase [Methanocella sp. CWC-04]MCD1295592.1 MBL fold metallo-hydrolase [Methanocella sp. CWC-04]